MILKYNDFLFESEKSEEMYLYVSDKDDKIIAYNILNQDRETLNSYLYDKNGKSMGGYGVQYDENKNFIKFDSQQDAQNWLNSRNENYLNKMTYRKQYPKLSYIAKELRLNKSVDYQIINRGHCFKFAFEIYKHLGYSNFTFIHSDEEQETVHVYLKLNDNLYFDAYGFHSKSDVESDYELDGENNFMYDSGYKELEHYKEIDTDQSLTTIPLSKQDWDIIVGIINKSKHI